MKTTLIYKQADLVIQVLAFAIPLLVCLLIGKDAMSILICLAIVQLLSCMINHIYLDQFLRQKTRVTFEILVIALLSACLTAAYITGIDGTIGRAIIWLSPLFAAWYFTISIAEVHSIRRIVHRRDDMLWS